MKNRILFLDRDGIININKPYISSNNEFEFTDEIFNLCKLFLKNNFKIIVVTNQSGIGRELLSLHDFHILTLWMLEKFESQNIRIEFVLASALNPEIENPTDFELFRRKPNPGLLLDAGEIIEINYEESVMIGDNFTDGYAATSAGLNKIFIVNKGQNINEKFVIFESLADLHTKVNSLMGFDNV